MNVPRLFNCIPAQLRNITKCSIDHYLDTIPDEPKSNHLVPSSSTLLTANPHLQIRKSVVTFGNAPILTSGIQAMTVNFVINLCTYNIFIRFCRIFFDRMPQPYHKSWSVKQDCYWCACLLLCGSMLLFYNMDL